MNASFSIKSTTSLCLILAAALCVFAGCSPQSTPPGPAGPTGGGSMTPPGGGGKMAASGGGSGQELLAANCRCHNGGKAPDLSHIGSDPKHTAGWIAEYANNPKSKDPGSRMPSMAGKVSSEDMQKIATYLASQK